MNLNGGFPPINKNKIIEKKKKGKNNNNIIKKKLRFSTTNISNVKIQDILSYIKIKNKEKDIINKENIDTIESL
tara:strand:- start:1336 stop:1557 length:222 start_codon:yes stop_codon:yes gene_type:complete